jgi:hypothetical protein
MTGGDDLLSLAEVSRLLEWLEGRMFQVVGGDPELASPIGGVGVLSGSGLIPPVL